MWPEVARPNPESSPSGTLATQTPIAARAYQGIPEGSRADGRQIPGGRSLSNPIAANPVIVATCLFVASLTQVAALAQPSTVRETVVDAETGRAVKSFQVARADAWAGTPGPARLVENWRGQFARPQDWWAFVVSADGYAPKHLTAWRGGAEPIRLQRGGGVCGTVRDSAGRPLGGALVTVTDIEGVALFWRNARSGRWQCGSPSPPEVSYRLQYPTDTWVRARASKSGRWSIPRLEPGCYRFAIQYPGHAAYLTEPVDVRGGEEATVSSVRLARAGTLDAVVRTDGKPDPKAKLIIKWIDHPLWVSASTDARGRIRVDGLPPGDYRVLVIERADVMDLTAVLNQVYSKSPPVVVKPGKTTRIDR